MKKTTPIILLALLCLISIPCQMKAQDPHLDVEGDVKIRGNIDINHPEDTTSVYIGRNTGTSINMDAHSNTFLGSNSGQSTSDGTGNSFFGYRAGMSNETGISNSFFGRDAGRILTSGVRNSFFGSGSGVFSAGSYNSFFGDSSGGVSSGSSNSFFGYRSGLNNTIGSYNVFIGEASGLRSVKGSYNTFVGVAADLVDTVNPDSLDRAIAVGYNAKVACHNCAVIGGTGEDAVKVGIGTTTPTALLHVEGDNNGEMVLRDIDHIVSINMLTYENPMTQWRITAESHRPLPPDSETEQDASFIIGYGQDSIFLIRGDGNAKLNGTLNETSDARLKTNISVISGVLPQLLRLYGYTYDWKNPLRSQQRQVGLMAQEVQKVFPDLVIEDDNGMLSVSYTRFVPLLIEGIREQQEMIMSQQQDIQNLRAEMQSILEAIKAQNQLLMKNSVQIDQSGKN